MNIAIVGATGNVGRKIMEVLEKKSFSIDRLFLVASSKSAGAKLKFNNKDLNVESLEGFDFSKVDITFFSAGGKISEKYVPIAAKHSVAYFQLSLHHDNLALHPLLLPLSGRHLFAWLVAASHGLRP